jgi:hypothetical protein
MKDIKFSTIAKACKTVGVSYLGGVSLSAKMVKNEKVGVMTYSINLSPAETSGYDVCSHSTAECRSGCLATSGHAKMDIQSGKTIISDARIKKTRLFFENQEFFMEWLIAELLKYRKQAIKKGMVFSARLNTISDIDWANVRTLGGSNIFELFSTVQFYDYTKNPNKFVGKPENYHLTFSFTGRNWIACNTLLKRGENIAMVFNVNKVEDLPKTYKGFKVINGDETDYRPNDEKGVIVGLKWKRIADKVAEAQVRQSMFVVQPLDVNCGY